MINDTSIFAIFLNAVWSFIISGWVISLAMLIILPRRQPIATARSWLLVTFFIPWLGLLIYLLIGENRLPSERRQRHANLVEKFKEFTRLIDTKITSSLPPLNSQQTTAIALAEGLGQMSVLGGNTIELLPGYDNIIDRLIEDIDTARQHVHMLFYIWADDETGRRVLEALVRAVKRGVKCRVLVDSFGALPFIKKLGDEMLQQGIELHYILPIGPIRRRSRVDLRNHRKIAVIDGQVAYTGSQNIINADYGYNIEGLTYRELMVRLTGQVVLQLQALFLGDWYLETEEIIKGPDIFPEPAAKGSVVAQTLPSGPTYEMPNFQRMVVSLLHSAQQRAVITTPYFIPDETYIQALQTAVRKGVEVVVIVSSKVDQAMVGYAQSAYYEELLRAGVKIYIYTEALLHAKHLSIDDKVALIGSGNMDQRSFDLNYEVSMLFYDAQAVEALHGQEARYIEHAQQLQLEQWLQRSGKEKFLQNSAKLISPLL